MKVAERRYLEPMQKSLCGIMAKYFADLVPKETVDRVNIHPQPLLMGSTVTKELLLPAVASW